jgi:hypothetical protein
MTTLIASTADTGKAATRPPRAIIVALIPPFGLRARAEHVVATSGLLPAVAWGVLGALASEGAITVVGGWVTRGRSAAPRRAS